MSNLNSVPRVPFTEPGGAARQMAQAVNSKEAALASRLASCQCQVTSHCQLEVGSSSKTPLLDVKHGPAAWARPRVTAWSGPAQAVTPRLCRAQT